MNYCKCFAQSAYCTGCGCVDCQNKPGNEVAIKIARQSVCGRDKNAFLPKTDPELPNVPARGCHCRAAGCVKKYCECFSAGMRCGPNCGCHECRNMEGHPELMRALGLEPIPKRPILNESLAQHYSGSSWQHSVERSQFPQWLKLLLLKTLDRDLVKAVSSSPSVIPFSYGYNTAKQHNQTLHLLEDELNPVKLQTLAFEMVTAARAIDLASSLPLPSTDDSSKIGDTTTPRHTNLEAVPAFASDSRSTPELQQSNINAEQERVILHILNAELQAINDKLSQLQAAKSQSPTATDTTNTPSMDSDTPPLETSSAQASLDALSPLPSSSSTMDAT